MKPSRWIKVATFALAFGGLVWVGVKPAQSIPAWSRKYDVDCSGCHVGAGFKLTRMGQDFLRSGHTMASAESSEEKLQLGDYFSVAQKIRYNYGEKKNEDGTGKTSVNSFEQHALSLYMGGPLQKEFSFFVELYWHENSGNTSGASDLNDFGRSKLADAYLQYLNRQAAGFTSVRFGQFTPYLLHLNNVGARLSQDRPYVINSGTVGDNPYKPFTRQYGLELSQYYKGFNAAAAIMNGTGGKQFNRVDNDLKKDVYGTLDYTFDDNGSYLGAYGYSGNYPLHLDFPLKYDPQSYDQFQQFGVMGHIARPQAALIGAFFTGKNKYALRGDFVAPVDTLGTTIEPNSMGYYIEAQVYALNPLVTPFVRYDFWDADTDVDDNEVLGPLVGVSWKPLKWGRLVGHFSQLKTKNANPDKEATDNRFVFEANFMF